MKRPLVWFAVVFVTVLFLLQIWNDTICVNCPVVVSDNGVKSLSGYLQDERITICGTVKDYSYYNQYGQVSTELILKNISIDQNHSKDNSQYENIIKNQVITQPGQSILTYLTKEAKVKIGSRVILSGTLAFWNAATNPGEFDAEQYYRNREVLFAVKNAKLLQISTSSHQILQKIKDFRLRQEKLLEQYLPAANAAIMKAMLFGNKKEMEEEIKNLYQNNGIAHILAISGLHVSLLGMAVYRLLLRLPIPKWLILIMSEIFLLLYGCMVGFSASTFRAIVMFTFFIVSKLLKRSYDMLTAMAVSAFLWLMIYPGYIFDCGFQLSYGAIIGIGILLPVLQAITDAIRYKWIRKGIAPFLPSLSVSLITAPILIHHYYELSFFSIALNIIVIPLMAPLLLCGVGMLSTINVCIKVQELLVMAAGSVWMLPAKTFACLINLILWVFEMGCRVLEMFPIGRKNIAPLSVWELILYYGMLLAMTILVKVKKHSYQFAFAIVSVLILLLPQKVEFMAWILDVGQGDCNVIFTEEGHCFVIDCGSTSKKNVGEKILIPFLKYHGVSRIDGVMITHPDTDHMNGIVNLLELGREENIEISYLYIYEKGTENEFAEWEEVLAMAYEHTIPVAGIGQGDILRTDSLQMECLYPLDSQEGLKGNAASLVMKVECGDFRGLFTGDLEADGEKRLLEEYSLSGNKTFDLLKVGHHGSSGSSSAEFLRWVTPKYAAISCGKDNVYGHPHTETLERLQEEAIPYLITYEEGAVCFGEKVK